MKVQELLSNPKRWTKGTYARDNIGEPCDTHAYVAVCWCLTGAIDFCYKYDIELRLNIKSMIRKKLTDIGMNAFNLPVVYNDLPETTHDDILSLCKELDI